MDENELIKEFECEECEEKSCKTHNLSRSAIINKLSTFFKKKKSTEETCEEDKPWMKCLEPGKFLSIPKEVLIIIFSFLEIKSVVDLSLVNSQIYGVVSDAQFPRIYSINRLWGNIEQLKEKFNYKCALTKGVNCSVKCWKKQQKKIPKGVQIINPIDRYLVLYEYNAVVEDELTIMVGDVVKLIAKDPTGWWLGKGNYVEMMDKDSSFEKDTNDGNLFMIGFSLFPFNFVKRAKLHQSKEDGENIEVINITKTLNSILCKKKKYKINLCVVSGVCKSNFRVDFVGKIL